MQRSATARLQSITEHGRYREQLVKKWDRLNADDEIDVVHDIDGADAQTTIGLCGFRLPFQFVLPAGLPSLRGVAWWRSLETIMMIRGLPMENLWMQKRRRDLAQDVTFMNKMVDEIVAERRKNAEAAEGKNRICSAP